MDDKIREACARAISETGMLPLIAAHCRISQGWGWEQRSAEARISQWLNPRDPHSLPFWAVMLIVRVTGRDEISSLVLRGLMEPVDERTHAKVIQLLRQSNVDVEGLERLRKTA